MIDFVLINVAMLMLTVGSAIKLVSAPSSRSLALLSKLVKKSIQADSNNIGS